MNIIKELERLAQDWMRQEAADREDLNAIIKMVRENERTKCALELRNLISFYRIEEGKK